MRSLVRACSRLLPLQSPAGCIAGSLLMLVGLGWLVPALLAGAAEVPLVRAVPGAAQGLYWSRLACGVAGAAAILLFQSRCLVLCYPDRFAAAGPVHSRRRGRGIAVAGMTLKPDDLRTSVLVTGVTGSSKTAGILLPLLAELFAAYDGRRTEALGAFIPEVKGDLVDAAIYLARAAGRCVSREVTILAPACRIPVVRYRDESGRHWYLSGRGGAGGSDAGDLFPGLRVPEGQPGAGRAASVQALEEPDLCGALLPAWASLTIPLGPLRPRFVGWRWEGARLWRAAQTDAAGTLHPLARGGHGRRWVEPPRALTAEAVEYVDSGVHYNLVDPHLPAAEVAERLTRLAAMARGTGSHGENDYFYEQARKLLAACLTLHRSVTAEPATIADLVRLATQDERLRAALAAFETKGEAVAAHPDLGAYFRQEWLRMVEDGRTATVIKSALSAGFDLFLQDPQLAETFCRPSTFSFEDVVQSGRIVGLVPGARYEQIGRLLGTACKLDFQSTMLARTARPDLNRTRQALYLADECHKYAAAGSATAGDPYFMNLSRSNQVVNVCATQSYAWLVEVLGREAANVYISAFGVQFWLQQTDPETCRRAAEICGLVTRERVTSEHELNLGGVVSALGSGRELPVRRRRHEEEGSRCRPEDFALLNVGDVIAYNKGRKGRGAKVCRGRVRYLDCTKAPAGPAAVAGAVREYYRELLENLAFDRGATEAWDHDAGALDAAAEFASYVGQVDQPA